MDMKELIERQDREAAERAALLASLPGDVRSVLNWLSEEGRCYLLERIQILKAPDKAHQHSLARGMYLGAIGFAFANGELDSEHYECLCNLKQILASPPA